MEFNGNTWNPMEINGNLRKSLESYGNPLNPVEINGILWKFKKSCGISNSDKSELRQNRNSDKIGTQTKSGLTENPKDHGKKKVSGLAPIFIIS